MLEQEVTLAEVLETADLEVKLWHQVPQMHKGMHGHHSPDLERTGEGGYNNSSLQLGRERKQEIFLNQSMVL